MLLVISHPLAELIGAAVDGRHPVADGGWHRVAPWRPGVEAVLAFTGHAVLAVGDDVTDERLAQLGVDGLGGAHHPRVLLDLAGAHGWVDSLDVLLALRTGRATSAAALVARPDLADHPRVQWARAVRDDVRALGWADPTSTSVATLSRGVAGMTELSVELEPAARGHGAGSEFIAAAAATASQVSPLVIAAVAPGNVASLRAFLAAGFGVVGSVQLLRPAR